MAVEDVQASMKVHYEESLKKHLEDKDAESKNLIKNTESEHLKHVQSLEQKIKQMERANDEIKNDYCKLAAEKETYERHYEKLERLNVTAEKDKASLQQSLRDLQTQLDKPIKEPTKIACTDRSNQTISTQPISASVQTDKNEVTDESINKLKVKFKREAQAWAKEKRRLESKIRHAETSNESGSTLNSPRSVAEGDESAVKDINDKLERLKVEYQRSLSAIQSEVKVTIDELRERNRAKIKHEVAQAQRRISDKLHAQYKNLLHNIVDVPNQHRT